MKTSNRTRGESASFWLAGFLSLSLFLAQAGHLMAQAPPGPSLPTPLASWSFQDTNYWTSDQGYSPISFTNISWSDLGDGWSLVVDTNIPAWLNYNIYEPTNGTTNLTVDTGSLTFWFAPNWSSGTNGGTGLGQWAQLIEAGEWTSNSSYGYWGLSIDPSGSNLVFESQDGVGDIYDLYTPISWTTNYFHFIALTYSATNVSLYLDGQLATNDPGGLSIWPPSNVLSNGVFFGSDANGNEEAQGLVGTVLTYGYPLASSDVQNIFDSYYWDYMINPFDEVMSALSPAPSNPSTNSIAPDAITGPGELQLISSTTAITSASLWITNVSAAMIGSGTNAMNMTFTIQGGSNSIPYDVFANRVLSFGSNGVPWTWMGQGFHGNTYELTNLPTGTCFSILGTPQDTAGADLTDAYQLLVSKTNPGTNDSDLDGLITGWEILLGLNPHISNIGNSSQQLNYSYTHADWINGISGIKGSSGITMDNEGNLTQVSQ